jgi:hypothetical protein
MGGQLRIKFFPENFLKEKSGGGWKIVEEAMWEEWG